VKGVLFADYVRMLRAHRDASWHADLKSEDLPFLEETINPGGWYPMETFERLGLAILRVIAEDDLERVRNWGRASAAHVAGTVDGVIVPGDPRESLMRFQVYRRSFFDFEALTILNISDHSADIQIAYGMSPVAEQAAAIQTAGFFEGLIELSDGFSKPPNFTERSWGSDARTVVRLEWTMDTNT
jgi:hypothetical protein